MRTWIKQIFNTGNCIFDLNVYRKINDVPPPAEKAPTPVEMPPPPVPVVLSKPEPEPRAELSDESVERKTTSMLDEYFNNKDLKVSQHCDYKCAQVTDDDLLSLSKYSM